MLCFKIGDPSPGGGEKVGEGRGSEHAHPHWYIHMPIHSHSQSSAHIRLRMRGNAPPHAQSATFASFTFVRFKMVLCGVPKTTFFVLHSLPFSRAKTLQGTIRVMRYVKCYVKCYDVVCIKCFFNASHVCRVLPTMRGWLPAPSFQGRGGVSGGGVRGRGVPGVPLRRRPQGVPAVSPGHRVIYRLSTKPVPLPNPRACLR